MLPTRTGRQGRTPGREHRTAAAHLRALKTFAAKREATAFLAEINSSPNRGTYLDPHAGKIKLGPYPETWLKSRNDEPATAARD